MMKADAKNALGARDTLSTASGPITIYRLSRLALADRLPFSIKILVESAVRRFDGYVVTQDAVRALANWNAKAPIKSEVPFYPGRVVLQDFTGVPSMVDLAALRSAMRRLGGDPRKINPLVPCDLVIDHSVQVDAYASGMALRINADKEFERNRERYEFLKWGQQAFANFRVVPPATGIVHQVNLEYLAKVVLTQRDSGTVVAFPDSLVGTDSHTTMINGLGVLGWGVGGIEAEAVMLGEPIYLLAPEVIGFKLHGRLPEGSTATDLVLVVTQMLRKKGVVDKFVEFYGPGLASMSLPDRATIANMAPEYGATCGFSPVDDETLAYLRRTGRIADEVDLVERYCKEQGLFRTAATPDPIFTDTLELDLGTVEPSMAGPKRPQDRVPLSRMKESFDSALRETFKKVRGSAAAATAAATATAVLDSDEVEIEIDGRPSTLNHGSVVIAAITSCTNTSNPSVMLAAGLLAKKAAEKGLSVKPHVKTSMAPGSRVVTEYLNNAGLTPWLERLGFYTVGYGCTTCIGNSGPLPEPVAAAVREHDLVVCAVLSGNRNFEGRIHPLVKANYLASPPLVVAYAIAGTTDMDLLNEPLGTSDDGEPVYLSDIWPSQKEVNDTIASCVTPEMFKQQYGNVFTGNPTWNAISGVEGDLYHWRSDSTYIQEPPFFMDMAPSPPPVQPIHEARVLALLGDSVTTDHISPAGDIAKNSPAGQYLIEQGVPPLEFNSYGSRRGNDRVMTRGTFANIRLKNLLAPGTEGGVTKYLPTGEIMSIYDAALRYQQDRTPLIVLAGKEYGTGSSRDWAAKGVALLGVRAVLAESFERIHRSNLVGMGVLPLVFKPGESRESLALTGHETYDIAGISDDLKPLQDVTVIATAPDGSQKTFTTTARIDTPVEVEYYRNGGILHTVLRKMLK
ncbi:MAG TPA: aconitate hydratase AcnA [Phycisphaerae bacterium]